MSERTWTPEPWTTKDVPGAGIQIHAPVGLCEYVQLPFEPGKEPVHIYAATAPACREIFSERWVQFEPNGWNEMQSANAARIVQCVNACAGIPDPASFIVEAKRMRIENENLREQLRQADLEVRRLEALT